MSLAAPAPQVLIQPSQLAEAEKFHRGEVSDHRKDQLTAMRLAGQELRSHERPVALAVVAEHKQPAAHECRRSHDDIRPAVVRLSV